MVVAAGVLCLYCIWVYYYGRVARNGVKTLRILRTCHLRLRSVRRPGDVMVKGTQIGPTFTMPLFSKF